MRRRYLLVPVMAASLAAPSIVAVTAGSSPLAAKRPAGASTQLEAGKALPIVKPAGRRWN